MNRFLTVILLLACAGMTAAKNASPLLTDSIPPVITCPADHTIDLPSGECAAAYSYTVTAIDNSPGVTVTLLEGVASGGSFIGGITINRFVATDASGNTATCSFTVTVIPAFTVFECLGAATVGLDVDCSRPVSSTELLMPNAIGCEYNFPVDIDRETPLGDGPWTTGVITGSDLGQTYLARVTNPFNGEQCWTEITVVDNLPPTVTCATIVVPCVVPAAMLTPDYLRDSLGFAAGWPTIVENCSAPVTTSFTDVVANLPCDTASDLAGTITRTWTVKDTRNNTAVCVQTIEQRRLVGQIVFPADGTTSCAARDLSAATHGRPHYLVNGRRFDGFDLPLCDLTVTATDTLEPDCGGKASIRRTWKILDACRPPSAANPHRGVQLIEVIDTVALEVFCPPDVTVSLQTDASCRVALDLPDAGLVDDCSPATSVTASWTAGGQPATLAGAFGPSPIPNPTLFDTLAVFGTVNDFPTGRTQLTYTATDDCGQAHSCSFAITVWDLAPPVAECRPLLTVMLDANGHYTIPAAAFDSGSADSCGTLSFRARRTANNPCQANADFYSTVDFCCEDAGDTVAVTVRVYDVPLPGTVVPPSFAPGHYAECTTLMRLLDTMPAQCTAPPAVTVSCRDFDATLAAYNAGLTTSCTVDSLGIAVDYAQFDTTCTSGTIVRTFTVYNAAAAAGSCVQQIEVVAVQPYYVKFPDDRIIKACAADGDYGEPELGNLGCENVEISYSDELFTDDAHACYRIERTWTIVNTCLYDTAAPLTVVPNPMPMAVPTNAINFGGPYVSSPAASAPWLATFMSITPNDTVPTDYSSFWDSLGNGYEYRQLIWIDDEEAPVVLDCPAGPLTVCDTSANDVSLWNQPYWQDTIDNTQNLYEGVVDLQLAATDACAGAAVTIDYGLYLDLDADGVQETVIASYLEQQPNEVLFGNALTTDFTLGEPRAFDARTVTFNQKYRFAVEWTEADSTRTAAVRWNTLADSATYVLPELPYGTHSIVWIVEDACGNEETCEYTFTIGDTEEPELVCQNAYIVNITPTGQVTVPLATLLESADDNCTPLAQLEFALRRSGTGTGFPEGVAGQPPITVAWFSCDDVWSGPVEIEIWARDASSNTGSCTVEVTVADVTGTLCELQNISLSGKVETETAVGVQDVHIEIDGTVNGSTVPSVYYLTEDQGLFQFSNLFPLGGNSSFTVTPTKKINPLNGVSTLDLVLISRHILGLDTLDSPYKVIAADANRSNTVSTIDIVELRRLILGIYDSLPNNTSWRFVDKAHVFADALNPFVPAFPETIARDSVEEDQTDLDFIGIKIGDVNNSVDPLLLGEAEDRSGNLIQFRAADCRVETGQIVAVPFTVTEPVQGFQFTLETNGLEVVDIEPGPDMTRDNFALFLPNDVLTVSWDSPSEPRQPTFTLHLRAWQEGTLSELLALTGSVTPAEAYTAEGSTQDVALWLQSAVEAGQPELFQNEPNPFAGRTRIAFFLPEAMPAILSVYDVDGRELYSHAAHYGAGRHELDVELPGAEHGAMLFYKLQTERGSLVKKMVRE
jgi:hypothetical protein